MPPAGDINPSAAEMAFKSVRRATEPADMQLTTEGKTLMAALDEAVKPTELAERYPRIVNCIAHECKAPATLDRYLQDLLMDTRGNRQGFPLKIVMELSTLREHYTSTSGTARAATVLDEIQPVYDPHR